MDRNIVYIYIIYINVLQSWKSMRYFHQHLIMLDFQVLASSLGAYDYTSLQSTNILVGGWVVEPYPSEKYQSMGRMTCHI
jgi:hypothetical protein